MNRRLVSYLLDNRHQIIENWLTEADVPAPRENSQVEGSVPVAYLEAAFDRIVRRIQSGEKPQATPKDEFSGMRLADILSVTCTCEAQRIRGLVCLELQESASRAFMSVFEASWDTNGEFSQLDRECYERFIGEAINWNFSQEIFHCLHRSENADCQFHL